MSVENYKICYISNKKGKKVKICNHHLFQVQSRPWGNQVRGKRNYMIMSQ